MTIPMPEPVAYLYQWELDKHKSPYPMGIPILTYNQAEAYAQEVRREALLPLIQGYANLLESGRDRIISLGGDCDPVDVMEASDPYLRAARALIPQEGK